MHRGRTTVRPMHHSVHPKRSRSFEARSMHSRCGRCQSVQPSDILHVGRPLCGMAACGRMASNGCGSKTGPNPKYRPGGPLWRSILFRTAVVHQSPPGFDCQLEHGMSDTSWTNARECRSQPDCHSSRRRRMLHAAPSNTAASKRDQAELFAVSRCQWCLISFSNKINEVFAGDVLPNLSRVSVPRISPLT